MMSQVDYNEQNEHKYGINLGIDFSRVYNGKSLLNDVYNDLDDIFSTLKKETDSVKEYWDTNTSKEVYANIEGYYQHLSDILDLIKADLVFLDNNVIGTYSASIDTNKEQAEKMSA